jgi:peptidoglycan hydrolase-like protein with peptidoglycan-binding domain
LSSSFRSFALGLAAAFAAACVLFVPAIAQADAQAAREMSARVGERTLRPGDTGDRVKALQQLLAKAGFKTTADGQYGTSTVTTVRRFQRAARLKITGIASRKTLRALGRAAAGEASINRSGGYDVRSTGPANHHLGDRIPLTRGMSGHDVKVLQDFLRRAGFRASIDGEFGSGTLKAVRTFEADQQREPDGVVDAADIDLLRSLVEGDKGLAPENPTQPAPLARGDQATVGADGLASAPANAPEAVKQIIAAGNAIATKPYKYGGGHGRWQDTGYDCSGSVSYALHGAGLLDEAMPSGSFTSWGDKGPGQWVTIYANGGHMYMVVAGLRFDTSGRQQDGTRWHADMRSGSGYTVVHPPGL